MRKIKVYSCVAGDYDDVTHSLFASNPVAEENVSYTLFTDKNVTHPLWDIQPLGYKHQFCARRTARWHKINSHILFPNHDVTVWIDGNFRIKNISVTEFVSKLTQTGLNLFAFKHPSRNCIYQEFLACKQLRKDNPVLMQKQVETYVKAGYPAYNGLVETGCTVRVNNHITSSFNTHWWHELNAHSYRDQLSFNYVAWKLGIAYGLIPGRGAKSEFFEYVRHNK